MAKANCKNQSVVKKFPKEVEDFANAFVSLQTKRHAADYDPNQMFYKSAVKQDIAIAARVIRDFDATPIKHRRAFAAFVLFKSRP